MRDDKHAYPAPHTLSKDPSMIVQTGNWSQANR